MSDEVCAMRMNRICVMFYMCENELLRV